MKNYFHLISHRVRHALGLSFALFVAPALQAQVAGSLDPTFSPEVGGQYVLATAVQPDRKILIGGVFTSVNGEPRNLIARLHPDGAVESTNTFNVQIDSGFAVSGIIVQADGKILVAGNFSSVNGEPRGHIARLHADGTLESTATFNPGTGANDNIIGMALQADGKILIGGFFNSVNGQPRNAIARLNANGTVESLATFNTGTGVGGPVPFVRSIAVQADGRILLGGYFTTINGQPRGNIARINSDGSQSFDDNRFSHTDGSGVDSVAVQADGKILIGGAFTLLTGAFIPEEGAPRVNIARLDVTGVVEGLESFNPGSGATGPGDTDVFSLGLQADGKILLGGAFSFVNDQRRPGIARLHPDGTLESTNTFNPEGGAGGDVPFVFGVAQETDGKVLLGGFFTSVNEQPRNRVARLVNDAATQTLTIPNDQQLRWLRGGAAPEVQQVTFDLTTDGGASWNLLGPGVRIEGGWQCSGLNLLPGGFVRARGRTVSGHANASSGLIEQIVPLEFVPEIVVEQPLGHSLTNGSSQSLGAVNVGGNTSLGFTIRNTGNAFLTEVAITIDGPDADLFTLTTEPAAFMEPLGGYGNFTVRCSPTSSGLKTATLHFASNDADENPFDIILTALAQGTPVAGSADPTFALGLTGGYVQATVVQPDGKIIIGGNFTIAEDQPPMNIARLGADGSLEGTNTFNPGAGVAGDVRCAALQADGKILIAGAFGIQRLHSDGTPESPTTFNPGTGTDNQVIAIAVQPDGKILLGGYFTTVNGEPRGGIARLHPDGTLESPATFHPGTGVNAGVLGLAVQPDGKIVIGGDFTSVDGQSRNGIARLLADGTLEGTNTFNPGTGVGGESPAIFCLALQPDGKILIGGYFTSVDGQPRNRVARLNEDGSLESTSTFNPGTGANEAVNGVTLQADGRILLAGYFNTVNGLPRNGIARLLPDGTVESTDTFNPGTGINASGGGVTLQPDGRILLVGSLLSVNEQSGLPFARLVNDPATQSLIISNRTRIDWSRGGAAPEVEQVTFEVSTNGGTNWIWMGAGTRNANGWEGTSFELPASGLVRARGRAVGATFSASSSVVEQITAFDFSPRGSQQDLLAELIALRAAVTNRTDGRKLDLAIKHLTRSLAPKLWVDGTHLNRRLGHRVFHQAKLTAWILCHRIHNPRSQLSDTVLQGFIDRIFDTQRMLATVAIDDAIAADASSKRIEQAQRHLARGDAKAALKKCYRGIHDYSLAWRRAARARVQPAD